MHGNLNHIGFFVAHVEQTYHKHYTVRNGWGDYVRPVSMYILYKIAGLRMKQVARYFKCSTPSVSMAIDRQFGYEKSGDVVFRLHYNQLLQLYIDSTKFYIRKRKFMSRRKF